MIDKSKIKRILIIKLRGIGDVVLSTIVLDNLLINFPDAKIDYLTDNSSVPVVYGLKQVNKVLIFPKQSIYERIKLVFNIRTKKYDFIIDFFSNPSTALITYFSGARYKAGYPYRGRKYAYNLYGPSERGKFHAAQLHLELLRLINITISKYNLYFNLDKNSILFAHNYFSNILSNINLVVGISPTGGWESKKCDPDKLAEIGNEIIKQYGAKILIIWGPSDLEDAKKIKELIGESAILAPATSLTEMAALISNCSFVVANDSGPMHISTAVGTPVLSLHGPTNPYHQGPFGEKHEWIHLSELGCIMCNLLICPKNHECFRELPLSKIMEKIELLIHKNNLLNSGKEN